MFKVLNVLCVVCVLSTGIYANVINFDDVASNPANYSIIGTGLNEFGIMETDYAIANGYDGFNWNDIGVVMGSELPGTGYANGTVSPDYVAFNWAGSDASISDGTFNFNGAYLTSAWYDDNVVTIQGLSNGIVVDTKSFAVTTENPIWADCNFNDIDQLTFSSSDVQFAMDNFTYNSNSVPEPATMSLIGLSLVAMAGIGAFRRKKK